MLIVADVHHKKWNLGGTWVQQDGTPPVHSRINRTMLMLYEAVNKAHADGCRVFVSNGDLLDEGKYIDPDVQDSIIDFSWQLHSKDWLQIVLVGNHERASKTRNSHVLGALKPYATVVDSFRTFKIEDYEIVCMPFQYDPSADLSRLKDEVMRMDATQVPRQRRLLFAHYPVIEACDASGRHFGCPLSIRNFFPESFHRVFLGDIHKSQYVADNALYTGAPIPQTFRELHNRGFFCLYDTELDNLALLNVQDPLPLVETSDEAVYELAKAEGRIVRMTTNEAETNTAAIKQVAILNNQTLPDIIHGYTTANCLPQIQDAVRKQLTELICGKDVLPASTNTFSSLSTVGR